MVGIVNARVFEAKVGTMIQPSTKCLELLDATV